MSVSDGLLRSDPAEARRPALLTRASKLRTDAARRRLASGWGTVMRAIILTSLLWLTACLSTPYQAAGWRGGYSDAQAGPDRWHVAFTGNPNRTAQFVSNGAMYRAAEIAEREGYPAFEVTGARTYIFSSSYVNFTPLISWKAELSMRGLRDANAGCPNGPRVGCGVYDTARSLDYYGNLLSR